MIARITPPCVFIQVSNAARHERNVPRVSISSTYAGSHTAVQRLSRTVLKALGDSDAAGHKKFPAAEATMMSSDPKAWAAVRVKSHRCELTAMHRLQASVSSSNFRTSAGVMMQASLRIACISARAASSLSTFRPRRHTRAPWATKAFAIAASGEHFDCAPLCLLTEPDPRPTAGDKGGLPREQRGIKDLWRRHSDRARSPGDAQSHSGSGRVITKDRQRIGRNRRRILCRDRIYM